MIFYFSATGNTEYVARTIAKRNGDSLVSIGDAMKYGRLEYELGPGEDLGFVTPTYYWGIPDIVCEFLDKVKLCGKGTDRYVYHVLTYGASNGGANSMLMSSLSGNFGLTLSATYGVQTVDNYAPMFDCSDKEKNRKLLLQTEKTAAETAELIASRDLGDHNYDRGVWALAWPIAQLIYERARRTSKFDVKDECSGCGLCEKLCPLNVIRINNKKPEWTKDKCTLCFACLHHCPEHAIRFGRSEKAKEKCYLHGQFVNDLRDETYGQQ